MTVAAAVLVSTGHDSGTVWRDLSAVRGVPLVGRLPDVDEQRRWVETLVT